MLQVYRAYIQINQNIAWMQVVMHNIVEVQER